MTGVILIGLAVLGAGIGIQCLIIRKYRKDMRGTAFHNPGIDNPDNVFSKFFIDNFLSDIISERTHYLWAIIDDGQPCAVAYGREGIIIAPSILKGNEICARSEAEILRFDNQIIRGIWLVRRGVDEPVYELDIQFQSGTMKKEVKIHRAEIDVDGRLNLHKFRHFVAFLAARCEERHIGIRDFIRD